MALGGVVLLSRAAPLHTLHTLALSLLLPVPLRPYLDSDWIATVRKSLSLLATPLEKKMPLAGSEQELEAAVVKLKSWHPSVEEGELAQAWIDWLDNVRESLVGHGE